MGHSVCDVSPKRIAPPVDVRSVLVDATLRGYTAGCTVEGCARLWTRGYLNQNQITDQGLASLLASPTAGVLPSLTFLNLNGNQITDEGCATLAVALRSGALPALRVLNLSNNPASRQEAQMVKAARPSVHFVFLGPGGAAT